MATLQEAVVAVLQSDWLLTSPQPSGLAFQVWNRWIQRTGPGKTPGAFDEAHGGLLLRNIVVLEGGDYPLGGIGADGRNWLSYPTLTLIAEAHTNGKAALDLAVRQIELDFNNRDVVVDGPQHVGVTFDHRVPLNDSQQFPGNVATVVRLRAVGSRRYQ